MEPYALIYYVASWLATLVLLLFVHRLRRPTKLNLPPGPKPLPIIGSLNLMGTLPDHLSFHELSKKYGDIMRLKLGSKNVVIASSVEMAKVILKTMDANFADRPNIWAGKYISYNYSGISLSPYGPYWRQARKMCTTELFSAKKLESYEYIRSEEMKLLLKVVHKSSGEEIGLKDLLITLTLNVLSRMMLGKNYFDKSEARGEEFRDTLHEMTLLSILLIVGDNWITWMNCMDLQGHVKRVKAVGKKMDSFLEHVLNDHEAKRKADAENFVPSDIVDVLLQNVDDPSLDVVLQRNGVKAIIQVYIINNK